MLQKKVRLVFGKSKQSGFGVFELLIVIFLIGIIASITVNFVQKPSGETKRTQFISQLNALCTLGWYASLSQKKVHRVLINFEKAFMRLETLQVSDKGRKVTYEPVVMAIPTEYQFSPDVTVNQYIVDGTDYFKRTGIMTDTVWFYISQTGIAQYVNLGIAIPDLEGQDGKKYQYELNPLYVQFSEKESQKKD